MPTRFPKSHISLNFSSGFKGSSVVALLSCLLAMGAGGALPSSEEILARYASALGGRDEILGKPGCKYSGSFELPAQKRKGSFEVLAKPPGKLWLQVGIPKTGRYVRATDGRAMWHFNPQDGFRTRENW